MENDLTPSVPLSTVEKHPGEGDVFFRSAPLSKRLFFAEWRGAGGEVVARPGSSLI